MHCEGARVLIEHYTGLLQRHLVWRYMTGSYAKAHEEKQSLQIVLKDNEVGV